MKKILLILLMLVLTMSSVFAESVDSNYLDLIFDKFASMSESEKDTNESLLSGFIATNTGLEVLYMEALKKTDAMEKYNISEADVRRNINALKTWSVEDRKALVAAGADGDKSTVKSLNKKNADSSSGDTSTGTGGAGSPTGTETTIPVDATREEKLAFKGLITAEISVKPELESKRFQDTENHWSNDYVLYLVERDIISGKSELSFDPEASISKAEIVTLVTKLIISDNTKVPSYSGSVADIEAGKWYDSHMQRGHALGLIAENTSGSLEPLHNSSREEVVEILIKAIEALEIPVADELKVYSGDFKDFEQISDTRKEAMTIAINLGFISGKGEGVLDPKSEIKRSEIAVVVKKLYLYIVENM